MQRVEICVVLLFCCALSLHVNPAVVARRPFALLPEHIFLLLFPRFQLPPEMQRSHSSVCTVRLCRVENSNEVPHPNPYSCIFLANIEATPKNQLRRVDTSQSPAEKERNFHQRALVKTTKKRRKEKKERKQGWKMRRSKNRKKRAEKIRKKKGRKKEKSKKKTNNCENYWENI